MLLKEKQIIYSSEGCFYSLISKLTNFILEKLRPEVTNVEDIKN